jgi:hypothetical protein
MQENSVNSVTFFCDATFKPVQSLNKIDPNQRYRDDTRSEMRGAPGELMATPHRCSQGTSEAGFRESRVEHLIYSARGRMSCRRAKVFASREPTSSDELSMASHQ